MATEAQPKKQSRAGRDLPAAIAVGVALFAGVAVGLIWVPWLFIAIATAALGLGVVEVHRALLRKGMRAVWLPVAIGTVLSVAGGYLVSVEDLNIEPTTFVVICLGAMMIASLVGRMVRGPEGFIRDIAASALLIAYIPLLGVFVPLVMGASSGNLRMLSVIAAVVASDTGAYATGVLFGRHKMAPSISPSKTWEGTGGGVLFAAGIGAVCSVFLLGSPWWVGVILGALISMAGTVGDLVESLIKRDAGIKDMSNFLPGHGGIMDRLDSMLVAVPVGWLVLHLALGA
ncbi:phosphatidate cytidylyltransferase [Tessaracoccus sp. MC1865]|uniref:phosphatidate cytidylyltransferase n=1 Tax=unclassified Tessaracoccus TaxID=2635419 RepID=UPI0016007BCA|nr:MULTISPECIES: phosphatidate cytidylyltransferase [unclassified Tessaracoccus]MBB1484865.1 phosphatidate cytidylyltransferase [Tessaracoccus sp. MC1865]MBB1510189.1 phosphatidate cytidylyltransferase [Tessaracoccus sp. MC1756]QTO38733.1 phosphatidate cytidylyltransferase [Tessaracoccus sp. MC1865]